MRLTLTVKLPRPPDQAPSLLETLERYNAACNAIADGVCREHTARQVK